MLSFPLVLKFTLKTKGADKSMFVYIYYIIIVSVEWYKSCDTENGKC